MTAAAIASPAPGPAQQRPAVSADRCKRLRHRQSECRRCQEICPEGAITLDPGPTISDLCARCGLCQTACPTEAFQGETHTDQPLLSRVRSLVADASGSDRKRQVFVHCREVDRPRADSICVPCLGSVTGNFLLGTLLLGAQAITLCKGDCAGCRLRQGERLFLDVLETFRALAPSAGLDASPVMVEEHEPRAAPQVGRRYFFNRLLGWGRSGIPSWPSPAREHPSALSPASATASRKGEAPGNALLRTLLYSAAAFDQRSFGAPPGPGIRIAIDETLCATCGTCVSLCPTGAIDRRIEKGRLSHRFNSALCTSCRLCEEACPRQVLTIEAPRDLRDLMDDEFRAVTDIPLHGCANCGETIPPSEGRFCLTCQRRGSAEIDESAGFGAAHNA